MSRESTGPVDSHVNKLVTNPQSPDAYWVLLGLPKDEAPEKSSAVLAQEGVCRCRPGRFFGRTTSVNMRALFPGASQSRSGAPSGKLRLNGRASSIARANEGRANRRWR